jgi:hypothetical protein
MCSCGVGSGDRLDETVCAFDAGPATTAARLDNVRCELGTGGVPVRRALPRPVPHLLCNRQVLHVVLDGLEELTLQLIRVAEVRVLLAFPRPVDHLLCHFD